MADEIIVETTSQEIVEVGVIGPQGPQGPKGDPGDVAGLPLSTQGDTLYRGASQNERLPIGQNSQVLKVVNGLPAWANESGAVASVNGETGAVVLDGSEIDTSGNSASAAFIATSFADGDGIYYPLPDSFINTKPVYRTTSAHHVFFENSRWHITDGPPVTVNIIESSDNDNAAWPWLSAWSGDVTKAKLSDVVGRARDTFLFVGDSIPNTSVSGLASVASSGDYNDLTGKPASFTPSSHASTHHTGGTDAIAPDQIGAQSIFSNQTLTLTSNTTLSAARAVIYTVVSNGTITITLPTSGHKVGDIVVIRSSSLTGSLSVTWGAGGQSIALSTQYRFIATGTGATNWSLVNVDTHTHPSTQITGLGTAATQDSTAFAPATGISPSAITGTAVVDSDARLSDSRTPTSHSSSHASTGSDPVTLDGSQVFSPAGGVGPWGDGESLNDIFGAMGTAFFADSSDFAAASHTHAASDITSGSFGNISHDGKLGTTAGLPVVTTTAGAVTTLALGTAGQVLTVNSGATGVEFAAASGGIGGSTGSVATAALRASGTGGSTVATSDINIENATTSTENNVTISNQHSGQTNSSLVLSPKGTGAFIVGPKPDGTATGGNARGTNSIDIQLTRTNANQVASGTSSVAIGVNSRASGSDSYCLGGGAASTATRSLAIGFNPIASGENSVAIGELAAAGGARGVAIGRTADANLRAMVSTIPFNAVYWGGQTTNNTATILNLDATATNRFTIAANTALAVDILLVARRSDVADKWLVARRFLGIRRDGSNNTSLIGAVQTLGTDQSAGSPTWSFTLTADDTNEALQLEVTGAASETVQWRATAIYRVV